MRKDIGVIAIGRNEGDRLHRCLASLKGFGAAVYVDSGSSDGSQAFARKAGFRVVELTTPPGFTAARARNAGLVALLSDIPGLTYVQMIDGDCEMDCDWLQKASRYLDQDPSAAVVFGRRRERFPRATIYNQMCDLEWNVPVGEAQSCGGDALFRNEALTDAGGYTASLIAGEEPDLCLRLRLAGWCVQRIDAEMTLHDVALGSFTQWWKRARRSGHAFAELTYRHWNRGGTEWARQLVSICGWSSVLIFATFCLSATLLLPSKVLVTSSLTCTLLIGVQLHRLTAHARCLGLRRLDALKWAGLILIGKLAELAGAFQFAGRMFARRTPRIIEYKK